MWYPANITVAASAEPITLEQARVQCRVEPSDTDFDDDLNQLIKAARSHVETYCGTRFASQTVEIKADGFVDFVRLPEAPVISITSITYNDTDGSTQTLPTSVYELRADGLETAIVLKTDQSWPSIQSGSRITVTAVVGYTAAPDSVVHAMLIFIAEHFDTKENAVAGGQTHIDALLSNHRRGI
jgi:uncharacterized phiE125 gp8 family phage protein